MPDEEWLVDPCQPADMAGKMQRLLALSPDRRRELMEETKNLSGSLPGIKQHGR